MTREYSDYRELLEQIVRDLSAYNGDEMLSGYLNSLAKDYNWKLANVDMPVIEWCHKYPIKVEYNETRNEIEVYDNDTGFRLFAITGEDVPEDIDIMSVDSDHLQYWVEETYYEELDSWHSDPDSMLGKVEEVE